MKEIKRIAYKKEGNNWKETFVETDQGRIYKSLAYDLRAKYIHKSSYITRIKDVPNYDGTRNITVYYDNGIKSVYTVEQ